MHATMVLQGIQMEGHDVHSRLVDDGHACAHGSLMPVDKHEQEAEEILPPLSPLEPVVVVHEPQLLAVTATSASLSWPPADWHLPDHDERQAEYQQMVYYSLEYELQVQQVDVGPPTDTAPVEQLLQQVFSALKPSSWKSVARHTGPFMPELQQVTGLRSGRFYAARVVASVTATIAEQEQVAFPAAGSQVLPFRTLPTPPGQMQAPALAQRARNALKLKWNTPDETGGEAISQYELLVTPQPAGWEGGPPDEQGFSQVYLGDERSYKLGKLGPGQRFSFKIRAFNVLGCGPWSLPSTFTTQPSVPAQPEPPVQVASTKDTATLQWATPADNGAMVSCYQLEVDDGRGGEFRLAYTGTDTHCVVQQLQSGLNYRFRLRAENSEGYSLWSNVAAAATAATAPGCPSGLTAVGINRTSVTLKWQPPASDGGSEITAYEVQLMAKTKVAAADLGNDWIIIFDGPAVATTFSALQPGCEYMVRVAARNAAGQGSFCMPVRLTTAADSPLAPPRPQAEVAATSLLLRWTAPIHDGGSPVTGYKVEMRCSPDSSSSTAALGPQHSLAIPEHFLNIYSGPDTCVQVTDLLPGTTYEYRAAALNSHGAGPWSEISTSTTLPAAPLPPPAPGVVSVSSSSLVVSWVEPYGQGSPVTSYTLNMARLGAAGSGGSSSAAASVSSNGNVATPMANGTADSSGAHPEQHDDAASSCSSAHSSDRVRWETVYTGPLTTAEVKHLKPANRYSLRVRAHNSIGGSSWGQAATVTTSPAAPNQPCNLVASAVSSSCIELQWAPPHDDNGAPVTSYQVEMADAKAVAAGISGSWSKVWQGSTTLCQHDGLLPGRTYSWRVRAINSCGAGTWSEPIKGSTLPSEPGPPGKPSFSGRTATSVKVKWGIPLEENGAALTQYVLQVRQLSKQQDGQQQEQQWQQVYKGLEAVHKVTGLQPGCSYEARVAAVNAVGVGPWSESSSVELLLRPPPPPSSLTAELDGGLETAAAAAVPRLLVSWPAAEAAAADCADAVGYEVEAAPATGSSSSSSAPLKATVAKHTSSTIPGLQAGVTYNVRVRSVGKDGAGHSNWSTAVQVVVPAPSRAVSEVDTCESPGAPSVASSAADVPAGKRSKGKSKAASRAAAAAAAGKDGSSVAPSPAEKRRLQQQSAARGKPKQKTWVDTNPLAREVIKQYKKAMKYAKYVFGCLFVVLCIAFIVLLAQDNNSMPRQR